VSADCAADGAFSKRLVAYRTGLLGVDCGGHEVELFFVGFVCAGHDGSEGAREGCIGEDMELLDWFGKLSCLVSEK